MHRLVIAIAGILLGANCVPPQSYSIASGHEGAPNVETLLLLPLNLAVELPRELQKPAQRISQWVSSYLSDRGMKVDSLDLYSARDLWGQAVREASALPQEEQGFAAAAALFVRLAGERRLFDAVVFPSLVYREARIYRGTRKASWDGVTRKIQVINEPRQLGSVYTTTTVSGTMLGVSLHVLVFTAAGEQVFERYGGLDVVHYFDMSGETFRDLSTGRSLKRERLKDDALVRDGISQAFHPYLPLPSVGEDGR